MMSPNSVLICISKRLTMDGFLQASRRQHGRGPTLDALITWLYENSDDSEETLIYQRLFADNPQSRYYYNAKAAKEDKASLCSTMEPDEVPPSCIPKPLPPKTPMPGPNEISEGGHVKSVSL